MGWLQRLELVQGDLKVKFLPVAPPCRDSQAGAALPLLLPMDSTSLLSLGNAPACSLGVQSSETVTSLLHSSHLQG